MTYRSHLRFWTEAKFYPYGQGMLRVIMANEGDRRCRIGKITLKAK